MKRLFQRKKTGEGFSVSCLTFLGSEIRRALHWNHPRTVQHMGIDHGRRHVRVTQQLLHGADIVAGLEQMSCKRMPQDMTADALGHPRLRRRFMDLAPQ